MPPPQTQILRKLVSLAGVVVAPFHQDLRTPDVCFQRMIELFIQKFVTKH